MLTSVDGAGDAIDERHFHNHRPVARDRYPDWKYVMYQSCAGRYALARSVLSGYPSSNSSSAH